MTTYTFHYQFQESNQDFFHLPEAKDVFGFLGDADYDVCWDRNEYGVATFTFTDLGTATAFKLRFSDKLVDLDDLRAKRRAEAEAMQRHWAALVKRAPIGKTPTWAKKLTVVTPQSPQAAPDITNAVAVLARITRNTGDDE